MCVCVQGLEGSQLGGGGGVKEERDVRGVEPRGRLFQVQTTEQGKKKKLEYNRNMDLRVQTSKFGKILLACAPLTGRACNTAVVHMGAVLPKGHCRTGRQDGQQCQLQNLGDVRRNAR